MHTSVLIHASPTKVYATLEQLFATAFNCSIAQLENPVNTGDRTQTLSRTHHQMTLTTQTATDTNTTTYTITVEGSGTRLGVDEHATSTVWSRRLNYVLFSLPVVDRIARKRLMERLERIQHSIEISGEPC